MFAQSSMLATLNHEGTVSTFYGATALRNAHAAAAHGDVITLSSGTFTSVDITKAITLRGAGMEYNSLTATEPTIIDGSFVITIKNDSTVQGHTLTMEGISNSFTISIGGNLYSPQFVKCELWNIGNEQNSNNTYGLRNASFINCAIFGHIFLERDGSATLVNSYVADPSQLHSSSFKSNFEFQNCVIRFDAASSTTENRLSELETSVFRNCIIYSAATTSSSNKLPKSCTAYNCIGLTSDIFVNQVNTSNTYVSSFSDVFKTWQGTEIKSFMTERLELTDDAKNKYLGSDGTQVGIYGGSIPFESRPSNPQITRLNVASKSTADGKLSVDIEVKAAE